MKCKKMKCKKVRCKPPRCKQKCKNCRKSSCGCVDSGCGAGCDAGGCDAGGCASGGCDFGGHDGATYGGEYSSEVPVESHPSSPPHESHGLPPAPEPSSPPYSDTTTGLQAQSPVQQASYRDAGRASLSEGIHLFWGGSYVAAEQALQVASSSDPSNALPRYFLALSLRQAGQPAAANVALTTAIETEKHAPLAAWGRQMQRVQGADRIWLEDARNAAGL